MESSYTVPYVFKKTVKDKIQYLIVNPKTEEIQIVYVHNTRSSEVKDDSKAKTISFDQNFLTKFRSVQYTPNLSILRFSNLNPAPYQPNNRP